MIEQHGHDIILKHTPKGGSMLELGDQVMNLQFVQGVSAKDYFTGLGYSHTSIDLNGKNGALVMDLSKPIKKLGEFDIITDIGCSEHVDNLFECLVNVFNNLKVGGVEYHKNPKTGNFPFHGYHYFTVEFWRKYAIECGLDVIDLYEYPIYHNTVDGYEINAVLRKVEGSKVLTKEGWDRIKGYLKEE